MVDMKHKDKKLLLHLGEPDGSPEGKVIEVEIKLCYDYNSNRLSDGTQDKIEIDIMTAAYDAAVAACPSMRCGRKIFLGFASAASNEMED